MIDIVSVDLLAPPFVLAAPMPGPMDLVCIAGSADGVVAVVGTRSDVELAGSADSRIFLTGTVNRCGG